MAEPQGLHVPIIITTGIVTTLLTFALVEGVCAYYFQYEQEETALKWEKFHAQNVEELKTEQTGLLKSSSIPIDQAMKKVAQAGGKVK